MIGPDDLLATADLYDIVHRVVLHDLEDIWHDQMFYGDRDSEMVNGTKEKDGSSYG